MSATDYVYDERDLAFRLFEILKIQDLCDKEPFTDFAREDFEMIVNEAVKFAKSELASSNVEGDRTGAKLENGKVITPAPFPAAWKAFGEGGWMAATGAQEYEGQGLPAAMGTALGDIFTGANCSFYLYTLLAVGVAHVLEKFGNDYMKQTIIPKLYSGEWGGTMVLTEPGAGSDVGNAKTKAEKVEGEDYYMIEGTKIFITGGDHDLSDNIIHLVLARTPGAPKGTKGLSLFVVPKLRIDENGNNGEFNDVSCVGIEHKMGIKGSATCQLAFGENGQCRGWLLGNEGDGIRQMFHMMNEARIEVGLQGCSLSNAAYQNALSYSRDRVQGSSIKEFKNPDAPRVAIIDHPDVRRQLLTMKAWGEGMRSLLLFTAYCHDRVHTAQSDEELAKYQGFVELLTPICKAYCTDRGVEMTSMAIQVYGGYGYTADYPVEQHMRDSKIGCIYEGTNSIQAMDLMGRKLGMKKGMVFMSYVAELDAIAGQAKECASLAGLVDTFLAAKDRMVSVAMNLGSWGMAGRLELATSRATAFLELMGDVVMAGELLRAGIVADAKLNGRLKDAGVDASDNAALLAHVRSSEDSAFYHGKLMSASFFINTILPRTEGTAKVAMSEDISHMDVTL